MVVFVVLFYLFPMRLLLIFLFFFFLLFRKCFLFSFLFKPQVFVVLVLKGRRGVDWGVDDLVFDKNLF